MSDLAADRRRVRAMLAGEAAAFDAFFGEYFPRLYRFVLPRIDHDEAAAKDICQESLARALRKLSTYRGEAALFTWLCRFARNSLSDYWQKRRRENQHVMYAEDDELTMAALESIESNPFEGPEAQRYGEELARAVHVALDHLPERYGEALEWKYLDGMSTAQIATRLGATTIAAQSVLQRAREAFKEAFGAINASRLDRLAILQEKDQ